MNELILYFTAYPLLAMLLFYITNWLGKYSENLGYNKIDFIIDKEDSIAFNFTFKILTSVVFIIIISSILYYLKLDKYTKNIFIVVFYEVFFRLIFNIFMDRFHIINKKVYIFNSLCICIFSYLTYIHIIAPKKPIIPDFNTLSNELWIIILIFLYNAINKIEISEGIKEKKLKNYIIIKYKNLSGQYEDIIDNHLYGLFYGDTYQNFIDSKYLKNDEDFMNANFNYIKLLVYSIMIFENFNRPFLFRKIETFIAKNSKKRRTLGIMQVSTDRVINDEVSIRLAIDKIFQKYLEGLNNDEHVYYYQIQSDILSDYNTNDDYEKSIKNILKILSDYLQNDDISTIMYNQINKLNSDDDE